MTHREKYTVGAFGLFAFGLGLAAGGITGATSQYLIMGTVSWTAPATIATGFISIVLAIIIGRVINAPKNSNY